VVISGRKTAAQMARMFGLSPPPTVSRIVAAHVACVGDVRAALQMSEPPPIRQNFVDCRSRVISARSLGKFGR
jgi:hypothetical protein